MYRYVFQARKSKDMPKDDKTALHKFIVVVVKRRKSPAAALSSYPSACFTKKRRCIVNKYDFLFQLKIIIKSYLDMFFKPDRLILMLGWKYSDIL